MTRKELNEKLIDIIRKNDETKSSKEEMLKVFKEFDNDPTTTQEDKRLVIIALELFLSYMEHKKNVEALRAFIDKVAEN